MDSWYEISFREGEASRRRIGKRGHINAFFRKSWREEMKTKRMALSTDQTGETS